MKKCKPHKRGKRNNFKKRRGKDSTRKQSFKRKRDLSKVQCFRCDKYGHIAVKCLDRPKPQASIAEVCEPNRDSKRLVFYSTLSSQVSTSLNTWVINSGASRHLDTMIEKSDEEVTIGDDSKFQTTQ